MVVQKVDICWNLVGCVVRIRRTTMLRILMCLCLCFLLRFIPDRIVSLILLGDRKYMWKWSWGGIRRIRKEIRSSVLEFRNLDIMFYSICSQNLPYSVWIWQFCWCWWGSKDLRGYYQVAQFQSVTWSKVSTLYIYWEIISSNPSQVISSYTYSIDRQ